MNTRLVFACAATGIAMAAFVSPATASAAEEPGTFGISPNVVEPGDTVQISATCSDPGFTLPAVFESYSLVPPVTTGTVGEEGVWHVTGTTTVKEDAIAGEATVFFECGPDGNVIIAHLTIAEPSHEELGTLEISPSVVRPGDEVTLSATCSYPDFTLPTGFESSFLDPATDVTGEKGEDGVWRLTGTTTVKKDAAPGKGSALFTCGPHGTTVAAEFTIVAADTPPAAQVPVKPKGAADTGSLASATTSTPESGQDAGLLALGALVVAGGGIGAAAYRRRQRA